MAVCARWVTAVTEPTQIKRERANTLGVIEAQALRLLTVPPPSLSSADCGCRARKAGDLRAAAGAWSRRVPGQQERGSPSVLRCPPGPLAGTQGTLDALGTVGGVGFTVETTCGPGGSFSSLASSHGLVAVSQKPA